MQSEIVLHFLATKHLLVHLLSTETLSDFFMWLMKFMTLGNLWTGKQFKDYKLQR